MLTDRGIAPSSRTNSGTVAAGRSAYNNFVKQRMGGKSGMLLADVAREWKTLSVLEKKKYETSQVHEEAPPAPKRKQRPSAYRAFLNERLEVAKETGKLSLSDVHAIAREWKTLPETEKAPYKEQVQDVTEKKQSKKLSSWNIFLRQVFSEMPDTPFNEVVKKAKDRYSRLSDAEKARLK